MAKIKSITPQIIQFDKDGKEYIIQEGDIVEVGETNDYLRGLIALGRIEELEPEPTPELGRKK